MEAKVADPQVSSRSSPIPPHTNSEVKEVALPPAAAAVVVAAVPPPPAAPTVPPTAAAATTAEAPQPPIPRADDPRAESRPTPTSSAAQRWDSSPDSGSTAPTSTLTATRTTSTTTPTTRTRRCPCSACVSSIARAGATTMIIRRTWMRWWVMGRIRIARRRGLRM